MNPRINYTLVGAFVVLLVLATLGLAGWMSHDRGSVERQPYITYFYDSVSGLNERAQVKYHGVPVGYVDAITLVRDPEERVRLRLMLNAQAPLTTATFATLQHQGVTGLLFVELKSQDEPGDLLVSSRKDPAEIPSQPSRLMQFTDSLDLLSTKLSRLLDSFTHVSDQLAELTNPQMRQTLFELLHTSNALARTADQRLQEFNPKTYEQLAITLDRLLVEMTHQARSLPEQFGNLEARFIQEVNRLQEQLQLLSEDTRSSVRQFTPVLQQTEQLLLQLQNESGSWLRSNQTPPLGPGE